MAALFADFTTAFAMSSTAALYIFFATYAFELKDHASLALLLYFFAGFLAMPAWLKLAYRMGKIGAIKIAIGYTMLLQAGMFFVTDPGMWRFSGAIPSWRGWRLAQDPLYCTR